ncbi:MAG: hypothetical protein GY906_38765 [bacterium]|nr:hypothetical protein [bacterium]
MRNAARWWIVGMTLLTVCSALGFAQANNEAKEVEKQQIEAYARAWSAAIDEVTPDGYLFEELRRCAGCHDASRNTEGNTTHRNAIGISGGPVSATVTGKGWLSGGHGRSQDHAVASNKHCAWCHAPSQPGVTQHIDQAKPISSGRVGVSCIACHASEAINKRHGHYQANFRPGGDRDSLVDFVPRNPESGIETNDQCLYCHLRSHGFSVEPHADLLKKGSLRCIDCHMAIYNRLESGVEERYHNMKVAANEDPATCRPCHQFEATQLAELCAALVPVRGSIVHEVPAFE